MSGADGSATSSRWFGARVDMSAVRRDAVLAGVFSGANAFAGTLDPLWFVPGALFGAVLGMVLHVLPAEPQPGDSRRGRITVRAICGLLGGAWAGLGFAYVQTGYLADNASMPQLPDLWENFLVGGITGMVWYVAWGLWETRNRT
jgi:hypothetical protein